MKRDKPSRIYRKADKNAKLGKIVSFLMYNTDGLTYKGKFLTYSK